MRHVFQMQASAESMYGITIEEATKSLAAGRTDDILDLIFKRYEVRHACLGSGRMRPAAVAPGLLKRYVSSCHLADSSEVCRTPSSLELSALRLCPAVQQRCTPMLGIAGVPDVPAGANVL